MSCYHPAGIGGAENHQHLPRANSYQLFAGFPEHATSTAVKPLPRYDG
jgi:hypothetical protein